MTRLRCLRVVLVISERSEPLSMPGLHTPLPRLLHKPCNHLHNTLMCRQYPPLPVPPYLLIIWICHGVPLVQWRHRGSVAPPPGTDGVREDVAQDHGVWGTATCRKTDEVGFPLSRSCQLFRIANGTGYHSPCGSQVRVLRGTGPGMDCPTRKTRVYP
jgi:hypothetical protein